ncbi:MAG: TonB-dependent receptor, partial [Bacteroidota bacterium]
RTGLLFIPGTWIKSIHINKGAGSVANGYESITGQINLQLAKPENSEKLLLNAYVNRNARMEINLNTAHHLNERWSTALLLHGSHMGNRIDRNQDGFRDVPEFSQFNFLHRWKYEGDAWKMQFGVQALYDDRLGGQMNFERQQEREATSPYGFNRSTRRYAGFAKIGYIFPHKPSQSFGIIINGLYHDQASFWGNNDYEGNQVNAQIQGTFQTEFSPWLKLRTGFSYVYDDYEERLLSPQEPVFQPERRESVPGLFTELTISPSEKLTLIPGIRVDFHNLLGTQWSPRFHGKYQLNEKNIFRLSAGRGFRVATPLNENLNFLISNRQLLLSDEVFAEKAWNYGASFQHSFQWGQRSGILTLDFYRSDFQEQLVVDLDARPRELNIYALDGRAYANSFQLALEYELFKRFDVQMAYKWYDVQTTYDGQLRSQPFVSRNSFFVNLAYATYYDKWTFDLTVHWLGPQRLPDTFQNPEEFQLGGQSPDYVRISAQVTRRFRRWEVYVGAENLAGFRQNPLIIQADQPFGEFFDAGLIYGPVLGRMFYSGFRFKIK